MSYAQKLHLRLFLEGIEVPAVGATVVGQPNSPAAASIQIPANDLAMELRPRTLVHLFFYDYYGGAAPSEQVSVRGSGLRTRDFSLRDPELDGIVPPERLEETEEQSQTDLENQNYKLHFGGEVVGIQMHKTPTSRVIVLKCLDWSSYWDFAFQYQVRGFHWGRGGIRAAFTGASTTVFNSFLDGSGDIVTNLMSRPPRNYPQLRGTLLGSIVHILESIGGTYFGGNSVRGTNDFFSLAELRLHLTQMIAANPFPGGDEVRLLRARGFGSLFRRSMSGLGRMVSIRAVINALQRYIFHETIPITNPRYLPPVQDPRLPEFEVVGLRQDPDTRSLASAAEDIKQSALDLIRRQEDATTVDEAEEASNRRGGLRKELEELRKKSAGAARKARGVGQDSELFSAGAGVVEAFTAASQGFGRVRIGLLRREEKLFFRPVSSGASSYVIGTLQQISDHMERALNTEHRKQVNRGRSQPSSPQRLMAQIYRPDVWMVAPPRCNVFFPELYDSFTYNRNFMKEVTRLMLRTHSALLGSDFLFDGFYMAPQNVHGARTNNDIGRGRVNESPDIANAPPWFVRDLMQHELYTGIIPAFERMSDLNLHAIRGGATVIDGVRVPYAQLAANHIFFQYRFRSRNLQLSGKFNPYCALGFPGLVIDKYLGDQQLRQSEFDTEVADRLAEAARQGEGLDLSDESNTQDFIDDQRRTNDLIADLSYTPDKHYLGTPVMVQHAVSVDGGGSTRVQFNYARVSDERTEFLGGDTYTQKVKKKRNASVRTEVAALNPPKEGGLGPRGGRIVSVTETTDRYAASNNRRKVTFRTATGQEQRIGGKELPLHVPTGLVAGRKYRGTRVIVGVEQPATSYGPEIVALVGTAGRFQASTARSDSGEILVTFRSFRVVEEVGTYERERKDLPAEELTFPPWYGEHYRSHKIGGLYSYFFGTGSIVDPLQIRKRFSAGHDSGVSIEGIGKEPEEPQDVRGKVQDPSKPNVGFGSTPSPGGQQIGPPGEQDENTLARVEARSSVEAAIRELVRGYSKVRTGSYDVNQFIRSYTWRPVATMVDMFGTSNLEIDRDGNVVRGVEGFHSRAFGDFDDLRQLATDQSMKTVLGLTTDDVKDVRGGRRNRINRDEGIAARLDTRKEKRAQVFRYLNALLASHGILG